MERMAGKDKEIERAVELATQAQQHADRQIKALQGTTTPSSLPINTHSLNEPHVTKLPSPLPPLCPHHLGLQPPRSVMRTCFACTPLPPAPCPPTTAKPSPPVGPPPSPPPPPLSQAPPPTCAPSSSEGCTPRKSWCSCSTLPWRRTIRSRPSPHSRPRGGSGPMKRRGSCRTLPRHPESPPPACSPTCSTPDRRYDHTQFPPSSSHSLTPPLQLPSPTPSLAFPLSHLPFL